LKSFGKAYAAYYAERDWQIGNDSPVWLKPRRHIYFLHRTNANGDKEYVETPTGKLRTWRTKEAAERFLFKLAPPNPEQQP
jgi:hypothetical protein